MNGFGVLIINNFAGRPSETSRGKGTDRHNDATTGTNLESSSEIGIFKDMCNDDFSTNGSNNFRSMLL